MSSKSNKNKDEDALIEMMRAQLGSPSRHAVLGMGDDAAILAPPSAGHEILITTDLLVEGTHFKLEWSSPYQAGWKAMAASVSDIAAMGGRPTYAVVSIGVRARNRANFIRGMYDGIKAAAERYRVAVVGGDTVRSDRTVINVTMLGEAATGAAVRRCFAKPGDYIYVTGVCGDSAAGFEILSRKEKKTDIRNEIELIRRHLAPEPVPEAGIAAAASGAAAAMMDLSDGLAIDLPRMMKSSSCGAIVRTGDIPVSKELVRYCRKNEKDPLDFALRGGEDFNLLIAARPALAEILEAAVEGAGVSAHRIGEVTDTAVGIMLQNGDGKLFPYKADSFKHF